MSTSSGIFGLGIAEIAVLVVIGAAVMYFIVRATAGPRGPDGEG